MWNVEKMLPPCCFLTIEIMLTIEFAVVGTGDGIDLLIEHGDLIGLEATGQITG